MTDNDLSGPSKKRVDESWKEQVAKEKDVLRHQHEATQAPEEAQPTEPQPEQQQVEPPRSEPSAAPDVDEKASTEAEEKYEQSATAQMPQASFLDFVASLGMQAIIAMGDAQLPDGTAPPVSLEQARYLIDILDILQKKTKGNLESQEEAVLSETVSNLKMRFVTKSD